jgi:hypothetical protein
MALNNLNVGIGTGGVGICTTSLSVNANLDQQAAIIYDCELFNPNSPATIQLLTLASGANTINATLCPALPQCGGVVLIPPAANTIGVTLKGASGDTGIALSLTAPTTLTFTSSPPSSFVLTAANIINGFRLLWF